MAKFLIPVTQVFRVQRTTTVEVEAESLDAAYEVLQESDLPAYDDKCWLESRSLENEEVG